MVTLSCAERDKLILENITMVRYLVAKMKSKIPDYIDIEDLTSAAVVGLIKAVDRYKPEVGVLFKSFAEQHIKGAILDELRSYDLLSRSLRTKHKQIQKKLYELEHLLGRSPSDTELANTLDLSMEEYHTLKQNTNTITFVSLDDFLDEGDEQTLSFSEVICSLEAKSPQQQAIELQLSICLTKAFGKLTEKELLVLALYYNEEYSLREIGGILKLTESRISQIIRRATNCLYKNITTT